MVEKIEKDEADTRKSVQKEIGPLVKPLLKTRGDLNCCQEVALGKGRDVASAISKASSAVSATPN